MARSEAPAARYADFSPYGYRQAQAGDALFVTLRDLRPTQAAIGYDQVFYTLARWQPDLTRLQALDQPTWRQDMLRRTLGHKFDSYCAGNGQTGLQPGLLEDAAALLDARLDEPDSFTCQQPPGSDRAALKSVIIGWDGQLYLTDGHHSFSALYESPDGGPDLPVWVRVDENWSDMPDAATFWRRMEAERKTWLRDARHQPIAPTQLPLHVGFADAAHPDGLQDDPYRSLVYFTRGIGYDNDGLVEFAEFMWADWLRSQLQLASYLTAAPATVEEILAASTLGRQSLSRQGSADSYAAAVRDASLKMSAQADDAVIADGRTASALGRISLEANAPPGSATDDARDTLADLTRDDTRKNGEPRLAGKLWLAVHYRRCGPPAAQPSCWSH